MSSVDADAMRSSAGANVMFDFKELRGSVTLRLCLKANGTVRDAGSAVPVRDASGGLKSVPPKPCAKKNPVMFDPLTGNPLPTDEVQDCGDEEEAAQRKEEGVDAGVNDAMEDVRGRRGTRPNLQPDPEDVCLNRP